MAHHLAQIFVGDSGGAGDPFFPDLAAEPLRQLVRGRRQYLVVEADHALAADLEVGAFEYMAAVTRRVGPAQLLIAGALEQALGDIFPYVIGKLVRREVVLPSFKLAILKGI